MKDRGGDLWAGTNGGGLSRFRAGVLVRNYGPDDGLTDPVVQAVLETRDGRIIVGTRTGLYSLEGRRFRLVDEPDLVGSSIRQLVEDEDGSVLIGTRRGLKRWTLGKVVSYGQPAEFRSGDIRAISPAKRGGFWIGTAGLGHFDGHQITPVLPDQLQDLVRDIREDESGVIWLAGQKGIVRLEDGRFTRIEVPAAVDRTVHATVPDSHGHVWLPTNAGLVRVDREELNGYARGEIPSISWTSFHETDGLPSSEFNGVYGQMHARGNDGRLWFASVAGIVSIHPSETPTLETSPARLEIARTDDDRPIRTGESLAPHRRRRIEFQYTAVNLNTPQQTRFRLRLEPLAAAWVDAGRSRSTVYRNLGPGRYRFRVEAAGRDGVYREDPRLFEFTIEPWFHERTAVRIGASLVLLAAFLSVPVLRERRMRRRQAQLQRLVGQRTAELSEAYASLEETARRDTLTGLLNRRGFIELAQHEVRRARRGKERLSIVLLDVDHFKRINDSHGHAVGDETLRALSGILERSVRSQDLLGRWGGEEFILLLPETNMAGAVMVAEKIRRGVEDVDPRREAEPPRITVTLGVAELGNSRSLDEAVHRADVALYQGKASGRNRVVQFKEQAET